MAVALQFPEQGELFWLRHGGAPYVVCYVLVLSGHCYPES